jgi:hypothetical protein
VGIEAGTQLAENGKISNVSGLLLAAIPAAGAAGSFTQALNENKRFLTLGLQILEARARGGDNTMTWAGIASQAIGAVAGQVISDVASTDNKQYASQMGKLIGDFAQTAIIAEHYGSEVAWDVATQKVGGYVGDAVTRGASVRGALHPPVRESRMDTMIMSGQQAQQDFRRAEITAQNQDPTYGNGGSDFATDVAMRRATNNPYGLPPGGNAVTADAAPEPAMPASGNGYSYASIGMPAGNAGPGETTVPSGPASVTAGDFGGSLERIARAQLGAGASPREINNYVASCLRSTASAMPGASVPTRRSCCPMPTRQPPARAWSATAVTSKRANRSRPS